MTDWTCCTLRSSQRYGRACQETTWDSRCGCRLPRTRVEAPHPGRSRDSCWMTLLMPGPEGLRRVTEEQREINPELTRPQRWDDLDRDFRDHATKYLRRVSVRARAPKISLRKSANQARLAIPQRLTAPDSLQTCHTALQQLINNRAQAVAVRASVFWQVYGKQSTLYFHHLARQRKAATAITVIVCAQGILHSLVTHPGRCLQDKLWRTAFPKQADHALLKAAQTSQRRSNGSWRP